MNECILISLFISSFFVSPSSSQSSFRISPSNLEVAKKYAFEYLVKDKHERTQFGRKEQSDGNKVQGVYSVNLPDGRQQTVRYEADDNTGFRASVTYDGEAKFPLKPEKADKTTRKTSKIDNSIKSSDKGPIPVPVPMSMSDHKPKIIMNRPSASIKTKPTSQPGIFQNILSSIKQFSDSFSDSISDSFSDNLNALNQNQPHKPDPNPISNGLSVGHQTQLPVIKPEAPEASLSLPHHPDKKLPQPAHHIRTTKRSTLHGNKQHRPPHPSLHLPSAYNINTEPSKGPEPYPPPDTNYSYNIHNLPPDRPTPKSRPYSSPSCLGCG